MHMPFCRAGGFEAWPGPMQVPGPDAQAYCAYLGDLSTLCVEAESLEERCTGALRCGCCTSLGEPDAVGTMAGCMCSPAWMCLQYLCKCIWALCAHHTTSWKVM